MPKVKGKQTSKAKKRPPLEEIEEKIIKKTPVKTKENVSGPKKVSLKQLKKYKDYLGAISRANSTEDQLQIIERMRDDDFKVLCTCMRHVVYDEGPMKGKLSDEEYTLLKEQVKPFKHGLKRFTDDELHVEKKRKLIRKKQKGGSIILGAAISALLPMAVQAIENWIWPSKKK